METRKLYYEDCMLRRFSAQVTACRQTAAGYEVTLSATAFYPGGGGQACDLGSLDGVPVTEVWERDGQIVHLCAKPLAPGQTVTGQLDWPRRFDLMQQHTGEHLLSGILYEKYGCHNTGFHIGGDTVTVDFDALIPAEALPELETLVNRAVWDDLPLRCWWPAPEELAALEYRSKRALPWPVRIVEAPGVDRCACCGVHVATTGQIGLVKLVSWAKFHQGVRIEMVCGGRALRLVQAVWEQNRLVSQTFSAKLLETGAAARQISDRLAAEKFRAAGLERRIFAAIAEECAGQPLALRFEPELTPAAIRELAQCIAQRCRVAAVFSGGDGNFGFCLAGDPAQVSALGGAVRSGLNGRGGGKPGFFQGSVGASQAQIQDFFAAWKPL